MFNSEPSRLRYVYFQLKPKFMAAILDLFKLGNFGINIFLVDF